MKQNGIPVLQTPGTQDSPGAATSIITALPLGERVRMKRVQTGSSGTERVDGLVLVEQRGFVHV